MSQIPERPATILATLHEATRTVTERVYLAFAMDDWISKFAIAKGQRIAELEAQVEALQRENGKIIALLENAIERAETIAAWEGTIACRYVLDEMDLGNARKALEATQPLPRENGPDSRLRPDSSAGEGTGVETGR